MVFPGAKVGACLFSCLPGIGLQKQTQAADGASRAASAEPVALSILGLAGSRGCRRAACSSAALLVRAAVDVRRIFFSTLGHAPMSTTLCRHPRSYHLYPLPLPIELQSSPPELPPETRRALASIGPWSDHVVKIRSCPPLSPTLNWASLRAKSSSSASTSRLPSRRLAARRHAPHRTPPVKAVSSWILPVFRR